MISPTSFGILLPVTSLSFGALVLALSRKTREERSVRVFGADAIILSLLNHSKLKYAAIFALLSSITVAAILGIFYPASIKSEFLARPVGIIVTIIYTIFAPIILFSYVVFVINVSKFFKNDRKNLYYASNSQHKNGLFEARPVRYGVRFWLYQLFLGLASVFIVYQAIQFQTTYASPWSPWVDIDWSNIPPNQAGEQSGPITYGGAAYYGIVRGVNSFFTLGILVAMFRTWWVLTQKIEIREPHTLLDRNFRIVPEVRMIGTAIIIGLVFSTLSTTFAGLATFLHAYNVNPVDQVQIFTASTFMGWVILNIFATVIGISILYWFHERFLSVRNSLEAMVLSPIFGYIFQHTDANGNPDEQAQAADALLLTIEKNLWVRSNMLERLGSFQTWPLPRFGRFTLFVTILAQIANLAFAVFALV